jgi:UDP:flavonoid glycosyltransferase YjiC (YdhE family)
MVGVRVLFTFAGGIGHAEPMVPLARALSIAGHTVAFAGSARPAVLLARRGFDAMTLEGQPITADTEFATVDGPPERRQLVEPDQQHEDQVVREFYATRAPRRRAPLYADLFRSWRPDVVVRDEMDFGSSIVAEALAVPRAAVLVIASGGLARPDVIAEPLDELRAAHGLRPDPTLDALHRDLVVCPFPPRFRDPGYRLPADTAYVGPDIPAGPPTPSAPPWWADLDDRPVVYVTLGTVFPMESGDLFNRLLAGLGSLPVQVVATVGPDLDPAELGPQPPHVHVEPWLPHELVLPRASLVVSHGGSGTVMGAIAHGVPQVVVPLGADQMLNAARVESLGIGSVLHPITATPEQVATEAATVMADPVVASAVMTLRGEFAALPGPEAVVPLLEALAG